MVPIITLVLPAVEKKEVWSLRRTDIWFWFHTQWDQNGGNCGECGDNYALKRPRPNENGGTYGKGIIVAK
jgi:hypothetical protein